MIGRKLVGLALAVLFVAAFTVQPAHAGLGGCVFGCHPQNGNVAVGKKTGGASSLIIDSLRWFLPTNVIAYLQGTWTGRDGSSGSGIGHAKVQGLGGCFFGCKL